jgi:hypothetical protein
MRMILPLLNIFIKGMLIVPKMYSLAVIQKVHWRNSKKVIALFVKTVYLMVKI